KLVKTLELTTAMLEARGKVEFWRFSKELYGSPLAPLADGISTPIALAELMVQTLSFASHTELGPAQEACHNAETVAAAIAGGCRKLFGERAPEVVVVDELSANALA